MTTEVTHHTHSESSVYRVLTVGGHTLKERLCFCETDEDHNGPVLTAAAKAEMIAKALAAVGADDGDPLTAEWLTACGYPDNGDGSHSIAIAGIVDVMWYQKGVADTHSAQLCLYLYPTPGVLTRIPNPTRGRLRQLCAALGVALKETK